MCYNPLHFCFEVEKTIKIRNSEWAYCPVEKYGKLLNMISVKESGLLLYSCVLADASVTVSFLNICSMEILG